MDLARVIQETRKAKRNAPDSGAFLVSGLPRIVLGAIVAADCSRWFSSAASGFPCGAELEACRWGGGAAARACERRGDAVFDLAGSFVAFEEEIANALEVRCGDGHDLKGLLCGTSVHASVPWLVKYEGSGVLYVVVGGFNWGAGVAEHRFPLVGAVLVVPAELSVVGDVEVVLVLLKQSFPGLRVY